MDMFGMMGEMMGNVVSCFFFPNKQKGIIVVNEMCVSLVLHHFYLLSIIFLLPGQNVWFTKLSDVFLLNSDLIFVNRPRGS